MKTRTLIMIFSFVCLVSIVCLPLLSHAEALTAYQIVKKAEALRDQAKDSKAELTMTLINKKGAKRERKLITYMKNYGNDESKALIIFSFPADVKGTSFLSWSYPDKDDQQWLYLPALQRVRQISSSGKGESFMGTEFSFYDMGGHNVDDNTYTLLREEAFDGHQCYVIESIPKKVEIYSKVISWIRKDNFIPVKMDFTDKKGSYLKQGTYSNIKIIKGINTPTRIEMRNVQNGCSTIIEMSNVVYDTGLSDEIFTQRYMQKGN